MNLINLTYCRKNLWVVLIVAVGVFLASAVLFLSLANAAEEAQIQAAIKDLSSITGQTVTSEDQAKTLCNKEQYLDVCADIGKKHNLYTSEEIKSVNDFLGEVKGKILDDIKNCDSEECLIRVAGELAVKIKTKNPNLATDFNLTTKIVSEKQAVVQAAKEVGVNFKDCESMNPDTASVDLLRRCAKLAKDIRVQKYIPEEKRDLANNFGNTTIQLREGLSTGKYKCGDGTLEGCGNYCLNPDSETRVAGIPAVCTQIAKEVFGQDGVKQLESSYEQVGQVRDYYSKKFILTLPNGKELVGENQIKTACDEAFSGQLNNMEMARACGSFAVKNGFASQGEVDKGLKLMESFTQKGQNVDFDKCLNDPKSCRDFIPEGDRGQFDAGNQIFEIMKTEIGFDPSQCERGAVDPAIGTKCLDGSKRALTKIESLGLTNKSKEAGFIVEDIKRHLAEGERMMSQKDQFREVFNQKGGPGGCKSEAECFAYCSNPTNGPECIAFGSQQNVSGFRGEEAVQKFQEYNQNVQKSSDVTSNEYRPYSSDGRYPQYPGQGQYPYQPPGQDPRFTQPGPGFSPPPGVAPYYPPHPESGQAGPSPECFAAIQSGDFTKAKTVCASSVSSMPLPSVQTCPVSPYVECPANQYRESFKNDNGCWVDGPCKPAPTYSPGPYPTGPVPIYSPGPTFTPSGDPAIDCQKSGGIWDSTNRYCKMSQPSYSPYPTYSYSPYPTTTGGTGGMYSCFYPNATKNGTSPGYTVWCEKDYFNCHEGSKTGPSISLDGLALGMPSSCESGYQGQGCNNNKFCDSNETYSSCPSDCGGTTYSPYPSPSVGSCPSGYHSHGESGGFCMNDQENFGGTCYNSAGTNKITCPVQPSYSPYPSPSGTPTYSPYPSYSPGTSYTPYPTTETQSCPSGQYWDYSSSSCKSNTSYGGCTGTTQSSCTSTSNCYWSSSGNYCYYQSTPPSTTTYTPYPTPTYTPPPSCPSGQWWDSVKYMCTDGTSPTPPPTTTYTPYPTTESTPPPSTYSPPPTYSEPPPPTSNLYPQYIVAHCQQFGRTWDGSRCQSNGLFVRVYENYLANALRLFHMIP